VFKGSILLVSMKLDGFHVLMHTLMSTDFIIKLPISEGNDIVIVVVDRLTKYAYIILTIESINAKYS
jgi:hypothetical protein